MKAVRHACMQDRRGASFVDGLQQRALCGELLLGEAGGLAQDGEPGAEGLGGGAVLVRQYKECIVARQKNRYTKSVSTLLTGFLRSSCWESSGPKRLLGAPSRRLEASGRPTPLNAASVTR